MTLGQWVWAAASCWLIGKDPSRKGTPLVAIPCEAAGMSTPTEASVTWAQALAWRMERQLLDPVGSESVAAVVRRLGAVLSMDESLAELAVRIRRTTSRPGELARALADGDGDQGVRLPRVDALPLARGRRHLPRAAIGRTAVGAAELGGVLPAHALRTGPTSGQRYARR